MNVPAVSVLLPFHNAAPTLEAAVASIERQTFADWELLLFDDGSDNASASVAARCAARDSRIRVMASAHVGIVEALRRAAESARGGLLARMDADDVSAPERLSRQIALMASDPELALCGVQVRIAGVCAGPGLRRYEDWVNGLVSHESIVREMFVECPIPHPTFLMRRDAYERVGGYQASDWAEDYDLCMRFFLSGMRFGKVAAPLLEWTASPNRLSMSNARYAPKAFRALKRHYLFASYLAGGRRFLQWGAGEVGKAWLREWGDARPEAVVDINPRKIGKVVHGFPVIGAFAIPPPGVASIVVAVGTPGAREDIRGRLESRGYREMEDFLFLG